MNAGHWVLRLIMIGQAMRRALKQYRSTTFDIEVTYSTLKNLRYLLNHVKIFDIEVCGLDIRYRSSVFDIEVPGKFSTLRTKLRY
jgi:hypothetical protein